MLTSIIEYSVKNKFIVLLFTFFLIGIGIYSLTQIPIGAVPDITNNQVQVITTSQSLSTQDMEQFITYPVELEMSNLPGVEEIRSTSKFGLSVVTIVFKENMGTYLPRQLIAEKLIAVRDNIPQAFGSPEMGPITTGLGEIYQYILDVKPEYKDQYSAMDLRTIQDWIVKRQLSGIPGVVEVNTWGGFLKQYEVAINTNKLNAMNISITDVYNALEKNNSVAGGGYIEKVNQAYFIRGEGLITSLDDIKNTVVINRNGLPVFIKDIAKVGFGSATRFGAITANGEGEKVLGQIMMLKGANSKKVIESVHERIAAIEKTLPKGVYINGFLDRSELIKKTTTTIYENLLIGSLIVIFVVILLLGNWRSGLIIASVIPLSLLFTLSMMYLFGIDANLMSLGAIDFGIIIDGAVIIVEFITLQFIVKKALFESGDNSTFQQTKDSITSQASSKMMSSAIFGQLIILIIFIPILTLGGIEGKMFKPMAITFSFALIGAMILGLTYVPAIAALMLKPSEVSKKSISFRMMQFLNNLYEPLIRRALQFKKIVIAGALVILAFAFYIFSTMGAEFIPTLDEGDFAIQPVLKTGTSLKKTVETTTKIEKIIKQFPEVKQVVSRIGAAEIPTDPMAMEQSDVIVTLIPKKQWTTAKTKDELADKFKEALAIIPYMEVEFTQPIEMRFNELISGVRSDIAIKIYGEDLDILNKKANEIKNIISDVEGAADITVEKTTGLPQMNVKFERKKLARYGLHIADLAEIVSMGFAGHIAGSVYEGEKKFDLVLRLDERYRKNINHLKNLFIDTPNGNKIPISEVANITYDKGAAKISRDNTRRRVVVGVNVRNRDLQSVVDDIKQRLDTKLKLPVGYSIVYGGQFENLESANKRLAVAVPIALILIFIMLFLAFKSVKEALIIYTAIPFAAVGGILLLWIREMPFSISAGIGFIALFGIAVLNGIVLIEAFKDLKKSKMKNDEELIIFGAKSRLRAVLLTALAAAFGFLPMAISTGSGAEVQRPLATVVIGGLITSTLLTLLVLPVLYSIFNRQKGRKKTATTILLMLFSIGLSAQVNPLSLSELKEIALKNNKSLKAILLEKDKEEVLIQAIPNFDKTNIYYNYERDRIDNPKGVLNTFGISQTFAYPTVYKAEKDLQKSKVKMIHSVYEIRKRNIEKELTSAYYDYLYLNEKYILLKKLDSLYAKFANNASRKFELGESNYLEKVTARAKQRQIKIRYLSVENDVRNAKNKIAGILQSELDFNIKIIPLQLVEFQENTIQNLPKLKWYDSKKENIVYQTDLTKKKILPDLSLEYNYGKNSYYTGTVNTFQIGLELPIFYKSHKKKVESSKIAEAIAEQEKENYIAVVTNKLRQLQTNIEKHQEELRYYTTEGLQLSKTIIMTANKSFKHGEIDFFQYIQSLDNAFNLQLQYLNSLNQYNQSVIEYNYLNL